jgi:alpha-ketoglutarate-dependent taurine dioxygenase
LHFLAEGFSLGLNFQKGDIQYINNLSIFHARDGFRDDEKQRYGVELKLVKSLHFD